MKDYHRDSPYLWLHNLWKAINNRCHGTHNQTGQYQSKGIEVYGYWRGPGSYPAFKRWILENLGDKPEGMSLDRIRNSEGYIPGNLRWATAQEQRLNQDDLRPGLKFVYFDSNRNDWTVIIKRKYYGGYAKLDEAIVRRDNILAGLNE